MVIIYVYVQACVSAQAMYVYKGFITVSVYLLVSAVCLVLEVECLLSSQS